MALGKAHPPGMTDAERRYLERVSADVEGLLGPGIELDDVVLERAQHRVVLRAIYGFGNRALRQRLA
jgi:hypothetical protein